MSLKSLINREQKIEGTIVDITRGYDAGSMGFGHYSYVAFISKEGKKYNLFFGDAALDPKNDYHINGGDVLKLKISKPIPFSGKRIEINYYCPLPRKNHWYYAKLIEVLEAHSGGGHKFNIEEYLKAMVIAHS